MQTDSVSNQREHLILLLANIHIRRNPKTDQQSKVFFCKYSTTRLIWFKNSYFSSCFTTLCFFCSCWCSFYFLWNLPLPLHDSCCSWMTMHWMMWWKDCLRITRNGANILVARAASGDCLKDLLPSYCLFCTCTALVVCLHLCCFAILRISAKACYIMLCCII
jgi:hypothetical protein